MSTQVTVVGIGADGWTGLSPRARELVEAADVVLGGERHLAMLPSTGSGDGGADQTRESWPSPLREGLPALLEKQVRRMLADRRSEALATRFAAQWLRLQDLGKVEPDALDFPYFVGCYRGTATSG